jgi:hypothetical protein
MPTTALAVWLAKLASAAPSGSKLSCSTGATRATTASLSGADIPGACSLVLQADDDFRGEVT